MTKEKTTVAWEIPPGSSNSILQGDGFYISYNALPGSGVGMWQSDGGSEETALCFNDFYLILNGDFRKEYERVFPDFEKCFAVYQENKEEHDSSWTTEGGKELTEPPKLLSGEVNHD